MVRFIQRSLIAKLITVLLLVILSVSLVNILVSWQTSSRILVEDRASSERSIVFLGSKSLEDYVDRLDTLLLSPYLTSDFMVNLGQRSLDYYGTMQNESVLKSLLFFQQDLEYLYFFNPRNGTLYSLSKQTSTYSAFPEWKSQAWIMDALESRSGLAIQTPGSFVNYRGIGTVSADPVFLVSRRIIDIETNEPLAVLCLAVSFGKFQDILDNIRTGDERLGVFSGKKPIFIDPSDDGIEAVLREAALRLGDDPGSFLQTVQRVGDRDYLLSAVAADRSLAVVVAVPISTIQSSARNALHINLLFLVMLAAVSCALVSFVLYRILNPLRQLAIAMGQVGSGAWDKLPARRAKLERVDEIGILCQGFYAMVANLDRLIDEEYTAKIKMQEAQLRALEAQINPHFLFNTIQSIGTLALRKGATEVYEMNIALADTLRYALQVNQVKSSIRDEISNIKRYVTLQKLRFQDRLSVSFFVDEKLLDYPFPKLILQPIIENSIEHNLEVSRKPLSVQITVQNSGSIIEVVIEDDGVGISPEVLGTLRASLLDGMVVLGEDVHIGLRNVSERLRIFFGGRAKFFVEAGIGHGASIRIFLPKES
jgi:sensor histidine kinase YesM